MLVDVLKKCYFFKYFTNICKAKMNFHYMENLHFAR